jgi:hypothetical protein
VPCCVQLRADRIGSIYFISLAQKIQDSWKSRKIITKRPKQFHFAACLVVQIWNSLQWNYQKLSVCRTALELFDYFCKKFGSIELEIAGRSDQIATLIGSDMDREEKDRSTDRDAARSISFSKIFICFIPYFKCYYI